MNPNDILWWVSFKTSIFAAVVVGMWVFLSCIRLRTPKLHRSAWLAVLALGLVGTLVPVGIPVKMETKNEMVENTEFVAPPENRQAIPGDIDRQTNFAYHSGADEIASPFFDPSVFEYSHEKDEYKHDRASVRNSEIPMTESHAPWTPPLSALAPCAWIFGMILLTAWRFAQYFRLLHHSKTAEPVQGDFAGQWEKLLAEYRIEEKRLPLLLTDGVGPALVRLPRGPAVVVPREFWDETENEARDGILRHEIAHYLHRDLELGFLARFVALLHWFNPAAWFAVRKFEEAAEWCADAAAFGNGKDGERIFAESMLALHNATPSILLNRPAFGGGKFLRRIRFLQYALLYPGESVMKKTIVGLAVLSVLFFGTLRFHFVPIQAGEEKKTSETVESEAAETSEAKTSEKLEEQFTAAFKGRVVDGNGKPVSSVEIFASIDRPAVIRRIRNAGNGEIDNRMIGSTSSGGKIVAGHFSTDADGRFEFKVPEDGEARIFFTSEDYPPTTVKPEGRGDIGEIVLKTDSAFLPTVRVLSPDGKPVPDVWALLTPTSYEPSLARCAKTGEDGTARFKPLLPGEYFLTVPKKPLVVPPVKESLDVPHAFPRMNVTLDKESTEFTIRAVESSEVTIRFADKRDISAPEFRRESWLHQIVLADARDFLGWGLRFHDGEAMGEGAYRFRVPRDMPIELRTFQNGGEYNYRIGNDTEFHRLPVDRLSLGKFDGNLNGDIEIELVDRKSPKLTLQAVDEDGKPIFEYWAYCVYPEENGDPNNDPGIEQVDGDWQLKANALGRMILELAEPELTVFLRSSSNFSLDPETGKGTIDRIQPDKKLLVLLFDKKGRQGFLDLNLKPGSEESHTVRLKTETKLPEFDRPQPVLRGRFVDEQGKPVPNVKVRITAEKPITLRRNAYDRLYHQTSSDSEGRFSCKLLVEGEASVMATPPEHAAVHRLFEKADEKTADVGDIVLKKGVRPVVRVLDPDGKVRSDVLIGIMTDPEPGKSSKETRGFYCISEKKDEVITLPMLLPGKYRLSVNEYRPRNVEKTVHYPVQSVEITPESFNVEIRGRDISGESVFPTSGRIVDEQGNPVDGAEVMIQVDKPAKYRKRPGDRFMGQGTSDSGGRFSVRYFDLTGSEEIREGTMSVTVHPRKDAPNASAPKVFEAELGSSLDSIVLEKGVCPTIRVLTSDGRPVPGVYVNMAGSKLPMWYVEARFPTDEEGRVTLPAVPSGPCRLMLGRRVNEEALKTVPCVFPSTRIEFTEDTPELEYRGVEAVSLTLRFSDEIQPEKEYWLHLSEYIENKESWFSGMDDIESLGNGVYRFGKVPKGKPLSLQLDIDDDWSYSYTIPGMEKAFPASNPEFGSLEKDTEIRITRRKAARAEIRCVDESGKTVENFYVIGMYPDYPLKDYFKTERVGDGYRLEKDDLDKRFLSTESVEYYDHAQSFRFTSPVEFDWNAEKRRGRVLRIRPDEKIRLFVFDKTGRQGFVETTFSEGEERSMVIEFR